MTTGKPYTISAFGEAEFFSALPGTPCTLEDVKNNGRVKYLVDYLRYLGCKTIITELDYVDADYLDDYASFYSKSFDRIPSRCRRLHLFSCDISAEEFESALGCPERSSLFEPNYLGFVVSRPLPAAIIGRTLLKTYPPDQGRRQYTATRPYRVNLFGIDLMIESLAYQEQDTSLAACATVALWSCFQKTQELFPSTTAPTPVAITKAANRLQLAARSFPSRGLEIQQICNAISAVGLDPEVYPVTKDLPFVSLAYSYLKLGVPVLAVVKIPGIGAHAIAINGFSLTGNQHLQSEGGSALLPPMIGRRINELYGHDDQMGPFCRLKLKMGADGVVRFVDTGWNQELEPLALVIPVYPKIRIGFREVTSWVSMVSTMVSWKRNAKDFEWDIHLTRTNDFKHDLHTGISSVPNHIKREILLSGLPKYIWRCGLKVAGAPTFEMILDTTAMVNGFPLKRLWWHDKLAGDYVIQVLNNPALKGSLPNFRERLTNMVLAS